MSWWEQAECLNADPADWDGPLSKYNIVICGRCPVRTPCAADAIAHNDTSTVRAGIDCADGTVGTRRSRLRSAGKRP